MKQTQNFIIQGRIPGDDDDTLAEVWVNDQESPTDVFIETILYGGNIPEDWKSRPPNVLENRYGEWAYVHSVVEFSNLNIECSLSDTCAQLASIPPHNPERFERADGIANPKYTNRMRAEFAMNALKSFQYARNVKEEVNLEVSDLICDLLHLVHSSDHPPLAILECAIADFLSEAGEIRF